LRNIAFVVFIFCCCDKVFAQDSLQKTVTPTVIDNSNTVISAPPVAPKPRRRKKLTSADSMRLAVQRDSILRLQQQTATGAPNNNPFNTATIPAPINAQPTPIGDSTAKAPIALNQSDNPFDILRGGESPTQNQANTTPNTDEINPPTILLDKKTYSKNFLFWIFMIVLAFMALVVANLRSSINNAFEALYSDTALRQIYKEPVIGWGGISYILLYSLFWINAGIFAYLLMGYYGIKSPYNQFWTFMLCIGGVGLIFLIKHIILYIIALVFPIEKEIRTYNFIILTAGILLGLLLMPLNLFIAYAPSSISELAIFAGIGAVLFFYLVRSLRGLSVALPHIFTNRFHFLLYLCAVEIAPLMILIKVIEINT
jgi:Domain of unknown function (DUF4271)